MMLAVWRLLMRRLARSERQFVGVVEVDFDRAEELRWCRQAPTEDDLRTTGWRPVRSLPRGRFSGPAGP